jgi:hypothetical protein
VLVSAELAVFLEQRFVHVNVVIVLPVPDGHFLSSGVPDREQEPAVLVLHSRVAEIKEFAGKRDRHPAIVARIARRVHHFEPLLRAAFRVTAHAILLDPHSCRQDQVCQLRRRSGIHFRND